jgi:hypothetical protein
MKKLNLKSIGRIRPKTVLIWTLFLVLFFASAYQTYTLTSLTSALAENGISFGKVKTGYNFSSGGSGSLSELPDMAGGC